MAFLKILTTFTIHIISQSVCEPSSLDPPICQFAAGLVLRTDRFPSETTWEIRDGTNTVVQSGGRYFQSLTVFEEKFFLLPGTYSFTIFDSYGDGICCAYGDGNYEIYAENVVVSGTNAEFGDSETTSFTIITTADCSLCNVATLCSSIVWGGVYWSNYVYNDCTDEDTSNDYCYQYNAALSSAGLIPSGNGCLSVNKFETIQLPICTADRDLITYEQLKDMFIESTPAVKVVRDIAGTGLPGIEFDVKVSGSNIISFLVCFRGLGNRYLELVSAVAVGVNEFSDSSDSSDSDDDSKQTCEKKDIIQDVCTSFANARSLPCLNVNRRRLQIEGETIELSGEAQMVECSEQSDIAKDEEPEARQKKIDIINDIEYGDENEMETKTITYTISITQNTVLSVVAIIAIVILLITISIWCCYAQKSSVNHFFI